jgi:chromosome segregation ATPase
VDLSGLRELANAPLLGLLLVVVILLIFLAGLTVRQMVSMAMNTTSSQNRLITDLQQQISTLSGQLEEMRRVANAANERGIRSALRIEMLRDELKEALTNLEESRHLSSRMETERDLWMQRAVDAEGQAERFEQRHLQQEGQLHSLRLQMGKLTKRVKQLEGVLTERGIDLPVESSEEDSSLRAA